MSSEIQEPCESEEITRPFLMTGEEDEETIKNHKLKKTRFTFQNSPLRNAEFQGRII
jgi:hypothetical protein